MTIYLLCIEGTVSKFYNLKKKIEIKQLFLYSSK